MAERLTTIEEVHLTDDMGYAVREIAHELFQRRIEKPCDLARILKFIEDIRAHCIKLENSLPNARKSERIWRRNNRRIIEDTEDPILEYEERDLALLPKKNFVEPCSPSYCPVCKADSCICKAFIATTSSD